MNFFEALFGRPLKPQPELAFTPNAQKCVALARRVARQLNRPEVDTEHLLAGILCLDEGAGIERLKSLKISPPELDVTLRSFLAAGKPAAPSANLPYAVAVKKVLALAMREARAVGSDHVGTDHLLLGIMRLGRGHAFAVLRKHGLEPGALRDAVIQAEASRRQGRPSA